MERLTKRKNGKMFYYSKDKLEKEFIDKVKKIFIDEEFMKKNRFKDDVGFGEIPRTIYKINVLGQNYFLKKFYYKRTKQCLGLNLGIRPNKSMKYYKNTCLLDSLGIKTVEPFAIFNYSKNLLQHETILVSKDYCENTDGKTYREFIRSEVSAYRKNKLTVKLVNIFLKLLKNNVYHPDFNLGNFLVVKDEIYCLDLESVKNYQERNLYREKKVVSSFKTTLKAEYLEARFQEEKFRLLEDYFEKKLKKMY